MQPRSRQSGDSSYSTCGTERRRSREGPTNAKTGAGTKARLSGMNRCSSLLFVENLYVVRLDAGSVGAGGVDGGDFAVLGDRDLGAADFLAGFFQSGDVVMGVRARAGDGVRAAGHRTGNGIVFAVKMDGEAVGDGFSVSGFPHEGVFHAVAIGNDGAREALRSGTGIKFGFSGVELPCANERIVLRLQS